MKKQAAAKPIFVFSRRVIEQAICEADEQVAKLRACEIIKRRSKATTKPAFEFSRRVIEQAICEADKQVAKLRACEIEGKSSDGEATGLRDRT